MCGWFNSSGQLTVGKKLCQAVGRVLTVNMENEQQGEEQAFLMAVPLRSAAGIFRSVSCGQRTRGGRQGYGGYERGGRGRGGHQRGGASSRGRGRGGRGGHAPPNQRGHRTNANVVNPKFRGFHLVGDSMISKLGEYCTPPVRGKYNHDLKAKTLGELVVHGQTASQLHRRLGHHSSHLSMENCAVLIGTNDMLKAVPRDKTKEAIQKIIVLLSEICLKVIVMTLPPIPRLATRNEKHLDEVKEVNAHIMACKSDKENVYIFDLFKLMMNGDVINLDLFQKVFRSGMDDNIHPNDTGKLAMKEALSKFIVALSPSPQP